MVLSKRVKSMFYFVNVSLTYIMGLRELDRIIMILLVPGIAMLRKAN